MPTSIFQPNEELATQSVPNPPYAAGHFCFKHLGGWDVSTPPGLRKLLKTVHPAVQTLAVAANGPPLTKRAVQPLAYVLAFIKFPDRPLEIAA